MILFDDDKKSDLFPLLLTRPAGAMRVGILTIAEKWERYTGQKMAFSTRAYLTSLFNRPEQDDQLFVNGRLLPDRKLADEVMNLQPGQLLKDTTGELLARNGAEGSGNFEELISEISTVWIKRPYDLFRLNGSELEKDFELLTHGRISSDIGGANVIFNEKRVFAEPGAKVWQAVINASEGPVYFGLNSEVMEGALIRGGLALGDHSTLKMGAKIYGPTCIGPHCKIGGEVNNSVIFGYSNKAHDGFLGNSVIGEWCNLGADSNNSNLKNNYETVKLWNYSSERFESTGLQFCGLIMGDHSKCGINTMFNTGTVVGVSANIFGSGFPRNFVPSFSWGGAGGMETYALSKATDAAKKVFERRNIQFGDAEQQMFETIFNESAKHRVWDKK